MKDKQLSKYLPLVNITASIFEMCVHYSILLSFVDHLELCKQIPLSICATPSKYWQYATQCGLLEALM